ncbi:MAG: acriflavine resistance protein B [Rhodospirillales bacterium RIFCSPLOWO2_12_FULL_58_28]|nr:MAG: acriflavine resistance protein B [Rhodospirillales bacterium RIFCSPLOWO2_02_FULL_58_16]OHC77788.1 MAG: acriflavine resistance protein B [Rhodospirillales bacterium RIFCSPLOWO2_12_FULL_58_28]
MNVPEICIQRPVMTTLLMAAIILFGIISYRFLPIAELPNVDFPVIEVSAGLPGASPETMAASVAMPLENQFSQVAGIRKMTSISGLGTTRITLEFDLDRDIDAAALDTQTAISAAQRSLPDDMPDAPSLSKRNPANSAIFYLRLSSPFLPISTINDYAETVLQQQVSTIDGVAQVQFWGRQRYAVRIQIDPGALVTRNLSLTDVEKAVRAGNSNMPTGVIEGASQEASIKTTGKLNGAADYNNLIVTYHGGAPVRIKDIGKAIDDVEERKSTTYFGNEQGMLMAVYRQPGSNTVKIVDEIKAAMPQLRLQIPAAIKLEVMYDRSIGIRNSIKDVEFTLMLAAGLVVMVISLFLRNLTATMIASVALPISVIGAFSVMYLLGFSLNNLSLMALTLAVGFVVDDAIVMLENIVRHREKGLSGVQAALVGSREVGFTILSMTVSLVAAFIPIIFMGGMLGRLLNEFALTIVTAVLVSGVVSLTLTPMMCSRFLHGDRHAVHGRLFHWSEAAFGAMLNGYATVLRWCLRHRFMVFLSFIATILLSVYLYTVIQKDFLPAEDSGRLMVRTEAGDDASFDALVAYQRQVAALATKNPNVATVMERAGSSGVSSANNQGFLFLLLKSRNQRPEKDINKIVQKLRKDLNTVPGIRAFVVNPPSIQVGGRVSNAAYQYTLQDLDLGNLYEWSAVLESELRSLPGFQDVTSDLRVKSPSVLVKIDRDRAAALGVDAQRIEAVLSAAFGSRKISTIYTLSNQFAVVLEISPEYQHDAGGLSRLYVTANNGKQIRLDVVTTVTRQVAPLTINHQGQLPAVTLSFNLAPEVSLGTAIDQIRDLERRIQFPASISTRFGGTAAAFESSLKNMGMLLFLAVVVVYLVLGILYESFLHPLTILSGLPAAGLGALLALLIFGMPLTLYSFVGVVMLIGIVKKNAIMMIDFALQGQRAGGKDPETAIYEACLLRFRPIMMTTFAALAGALPIAFGFGSGAEARSPLGITVVGGLIVSQVITLFLTPVIYLYLDKLQRLLSGNAVEIEQPAPAPAGE